MTIVESKIGKPRRLKVFARERKRSRSSKSTQWLGKPRGWMKTCQEMKEYQAGLGQRPISVSEDELDSLTMNIKLD